MPRINETTDTDLKVIIEIATTRLDERGDALLYQQEFALSPEQRKMFDCGKRKVLL